MGIKSILRSLILYPGTIKKLNPSHFCYNCKKELNEKPYEGNLLSNLCDNCLYIFGRYCMMDGLDVEGKEAINNLLEKLGCKND